MPNDVHDHYEQLASDYDDFWVYGADYIPWMSRQISKALHLNPSDRIADVYCGTGLFTREVVRQVRPADPLLCVAPSAGMLRQLRQPDPPPNVN